MPSIKLEFGKGSFPALDETVLDGFVFASSMDLYEDEVGARFKRPGLQQIGSGSIDLPAQGLFWSVSLNTYIAVGNGKVYSVAMQGDVTELTGAIVSSSLPATFTESSTHVYITTGTVVAKTDGYTVELVTDPVWKELNSTHLAWIDGHILFNQADTNYFWWTDVGSDTVGGNSSESANADQDKIVAIGAAFRELTLWGTRSTEIWYNTGETPGTFQRLEGAFIERGCCAPYTPIKADNTWFWLDHERNFIKLEGRSPKVVSQPICKILRDFSEVADFKCNQFQYDNRRFIVLSSERNNVTFIYDYVLDVWHHWGVWDEINAVYNMWPISCIAFGLVDEAYMVLGTDGSFYRVYGEAADARFLLRTAPMSLGTYKHKTVIEMLLRMKRGYCEEAEVSPKFWFRTRKDGREWGNEHYIQVGPRGVYKPIEHVHRLGRFRTIQLEFGQTDAASFALVGGEFEVEESDD